MTIWNHPRIRAGIYQSLILLCVVFVMWEAISNAATNMAARGIPTSFDFWNRTAGFDINQSLIHYSSQSTYGQAFWVGLLNTLLVAMISMIGATLVGFMIGLGRLSKNWIIAKLSYAYVELVRNIPLLLQLLFWYNAVLKPLPSPRQSLSFFDIIFLNNRGLILPDFSLSDNSTLFFAIMAIGFLITLAAITSVRHINLPKKIYFYIAIVICAITALLIEARIIGSPLTLSYPHLRGFNFDGGMRILPECVALIFGLSLYTASFIAEIVRAGVKSISRGQIEAAQSLALPAHMTLVKIIIPQAMRVIIPPLTNQFLNLTKNSSLAVFIGYPDLVQVFMGTVLNQTGAAVQVIAVTMAVYLTLSLITAAVMNMINARMALRGAR
jgi:general L-amino acid transport system permease protein